MKYIALSFAVYLLAFGLAGAVAQSSTDTMRDAARAYENRDFRAAIAFYEGLVSNGITDPNLYFNLARSYEQIGDLGQAMLNLRRAHQLSPRDTEINMAIARIRIQRIDLQTGESGIVADLAALTTEITTIRELAIIVLILWAGWFGFIAATITIRRHITMLRPTLYVVGAILILALILLASRLFRDPTAIVLHNATPVFSGPNDEQYIEIFQIHAAAEIGILEEKDAWIRFSLPDGRQGWVRLENIEEV